MAVPNKQWKDSLERLDCPFTQSLSQEEVTHLLLNGSEERLDILEWLLLLYQPRLSEILDPACRESGRRIKLKSERILKAVSLIGLCRAEDADSIIKGVAPQTKQMFFIDTLMQLVISKEFGQRRFSAREASTFIDRLADGGMFRDTGAKVNLIPKDLKAEVDSLLSSGKHEQSSVEDLRKNYQECVKEVETLQEELAELQKKTAMPAASQLKEVNAMTQMLSSSILDLDQLSSGFLHSYESHIGVWCQRAQPELNDIGPSAKRVHTQLTKFIAYLEDLNKLRQVRGDLEDNMKEKRIRKLVEAASSDNSPSDSIQRCLSILEETIHRTESGFKSRYPNLLHL